MPELLTSILSSSSERGEFPFLAYFVSGWCHQDVELLDEGLEDTVGSFRNSVTVDGLIEASQNIIDFLKTYGQSDELLSTEFKRVFGPETDVAAWTGLSVRQWLKRVNDLLKAPPKNS